MLRKLVNNLSCFSVFGNFYLNIKTYRMYKYILFILLQFPLSLYAQNETPYILVLGVAQDGGYPHTGCQKKCCTRAWENDSLKRYVVSLALVDPQHKKWWLFEATPDVKYQLHYFQQLTGGQYSFVPDGIFLTHAHIGHYTGLMDFGKEVMSTRNVPVYTLPKMAAFLENNGPWSQLVKLNNILLKPLEADSPVHLSDNISVTAFTVPHRDEYSETAGFKIMTGQKKYLFIPDINGWDKWDRSIIDEVKTVDIALVDATFYDYDDLPNLHHTSVPHPLVINTMELFGAADAVTKAKIYFIHFNHTNPMLWDTEKQNLVKQAGFNFAVQGGRL